MGWRVAGRVVYVSYEWCFKMCLDKWVAEKNEAGSESRCKKIR
jgi:hypothetical protein